MFKYFSTIAYPKFKLAIVVLIAVNVVIYAAVDNLIGAVDSLAWLMLLVLYELDANCAGLMGDKNLHRIRTFLIVVIALVFLAYVHDREWLEVINFIFWFALITLLELEAHLPDKVFKYRISYWWATVIVFTGLIAMVMVWACQSAWLDVYDAILWVIAFGSIEVDMNRILKRNFLNNKNC